MPRRDEGGGEGIALVELVFPPWIVEGVGDPLQQGLRRVWEAGGRQRGDSLKRSLALIRESNILDEAYAVATDFRDRALRALEVIPASESKESLIDVAYWVTQRRA